MKNERIKTMKKKKIWKEFIKWEKNDQEWNRRGKCPKKENEWKINEIQIKETDEEI